MKAIVQDRYGSAEVLELRDIAKPIPAEDEVLIEVAAASLHAGDYFLTSGLPYLMRLGTGFRKPRKSTPGFDMAGTVVAVGSKVTEFTPGDEVFGEANGSCAEYIVTSPKKILPKPVNLTSEQAATMAVSGTAALRGIRDAGNVKPGDKVLINGAAGGVGTFAVQIAKATGAEVTGVCSTGNVEMLRTIGADHVIDYTQEDFTKGDARYDVILDNVANHSPASMRGVLVPTGKLIPNSGRSDGKIFGAFGRMIGGLVSSLFLRRQGRPYFAPVKKNGLTALKELVEAGDVTPVIGETYPLEATPAAMAAIGAGHSRGKIIINV